MNWEKKKKKLGSADMEEMSEAQPGTAGGPCAPRSAVAPATKSKLLWEQSVLFLSDSRPCCLSAHKEGKV